LSDNETVNNANTRERITKGPCESNQESGLNSVRTTLAKCVVLYFRKRVADTCTRAFMGIVCW